jgi:hypothetical protein
MERLTFHFIYISEGSGNGEIMKRISFGDRTSRTQGEECNRIDTSPGFCKRGGLDTIHRPSTFMFQSTLFTHRSIALLPITLSAKIPLEKAHPRNLETLGDHQKGGILPTK